MTNKELIRYLKLYDPDDDVYVKGDEGTDACSVETVYHVSHEGGGPVGVVVLSAQPTVENK